MSSTTIASLARKPSSRFQSQTRQLFSQKAIIQLTDSAANRIKSLLEKRGKEYLKLSVKTRGCSGLSYHLTYADEKAKLDELVEQKGVKVLIEPKAMMHVVGTTVDFVDERLKSEFVFSNPNAKGKCGCGESFMT